MEACPFHCIYCDQIKISGHKKLPHAEEIVLIVEKYLSTIRSEQNEVEVGFFGGTFTGLKPNVQESYLEMIQPLINSGKISGIRISTRPDMIDEDGLELLQRLSVKTIELGAQSMDNDVLKKSGRGHSADDVIAASKLIKKRGLRLGLQMMIGLPGDSMEKSIHTASKFIEMGANDVRIYPTLVINGTALEKLYLKGQYVPLSLDEAIDITTKVLVTFEKSNTNIIRVGLHPSEELLNNKGLIAGPFHVSFRELVNTKIWSNLLESVCNKKSASTINITVPENEINYAVGYKKANRKMLESFFDKVVFKTSDKLKKREFYVDYH
jgi:histone acetyltransferase (RNA polymerase elongator complex component)